MDPGDAFDRYTIEARIGAGGMGEVYRAYDPKLHRRVALKVLHLVGSGSQEQAERILREARAAAALDHPNAVHIYDVGEQDGRPFMAMELVEGKSLRAMVGDASIEIDRKIRWICDIGRALAAAHRRGLVHRDVKPDNVMVRDDGSIKVLDFGIARRAQAPIDPNAPTAVAAVGTLTGDGVVVGTPMYMPPEQMRGEPVDHRTDQFAWGVLAFELLTGKLPWGDATDGVKLVAAMLSQDAPSLRSVDGKVPEHVDFAVHRALSRKREDRFSTMAEAIATMEGTSTDARRSTMVPAAKRRDWRPALVVVGVVAVGVIASTWKKLRSSPTTATHESPSISASASTPRGVAVTDLPTPKTSNAEAAAAYREGLQALRDGSWDLARRAFERACAADPSMAAALLRAAITAWGNHHEDEGREHWQKLVLQRALLDERERMIFDAFGVVIPRDHPDWTEHRKRIAAAVSQMPMDAELSMMLAEADMRLDEKDRAIAEYDRSIALDPSYADAVTGRLSALTSMGRFDDARAGQEECEQKFPNSADCVWIQIWMDQWIGPCDAMEAATRRYIERDNDSSAAWFERAQALYALGRPVESVREALDHAASLFPEAKRAARRKSWEIDLAVAEGDFVSVERLGVELEPMIASELSESMHLSLARARIAAFLESGKLADAARTAQDFLKRRDVWKPVFEVNNDWDARLSMNHVLLMNGTIDDKTFESMRSGLLYELESTTGMSSGMRWIAGWANVTETEGEARRALDALAQLGPLPKYLGVYEPDVGRTFAVAARTDDALTHLERATHACFPLVAPRAFRRSSHFLGAAYEAKGDVANACRAYGDVVAHWGSAKPKSITADLAKARISALKCITP